MQIKKLVELVAQKKVVLPEFQRGYIWSREQARQLLISLIKKYPIGSLLLWQPDKMTKLRRDPNLSAAVDKDIMPEKTDLKAIIDGQQRLTTLFMLIKGDIPHYYGKNNAIEYDPRDLYYNLETSYFEYYHHHKMGTDILWQKVTDCFSADFQIEKIYADEKLSSPEKESVKHNLALLREISNVEIPTEQATSTINFGQIIEVFDRINFQGTHLTESDRVMTYIVSKWPQSRQEIKGKIDKFAKMGFTLEWEFFVRCMVIAITGDPSFNSLHFDIHQSMTKDKYREAFVKVSSAIEILIQMLKKKAYVDSFDELSTKYVTVPIIAYLIKHGTFRKLKDEKGFIYWMFIASIWQRYDSLREQRLSRDVYIAMHTHNPVEQLIRVIEDINGRTRVRSDDIEGHGAGHPFHKMLFIITKWRHARDWVDHKLIRDKISEYLLFHSQHIFPQGMLYNRLYNSAKSTDRKKVNEIANRAFMTVKSEYDFAHKHPAKYLQTVPTEYLEDQFIPADESLWEIDMFTSFLEQRRILIAQGVNEFLASFGYQMRGQTHPKNIRHLIEQGENNYVEFKAVLKGSQYLKSENVKPIDFQVAKTIAAFANSGGGVLLIGVDDNGEVVGIESDYELLGNRPNKDGFLLYLTQVVNNNLGKDINAFISARIVRIDEHDVCVIEVTESTTPVYIEKAGNNYLYIRAAASSEPLSEREADSYIEKHW